MLFFHRPPYYEVTDGKPEGFLIQLTRNILTKAQVDHVFMEIPPSRIMLFLKKSKEASCSVGWFKNKDREDFANFSLPIYQNKPLVILTAKSKASLFETHKSIREVFSDRHLILTVVDSFSYGTKLDEFINKYTPNVHTINTRQNLLPRLILANRTSYMLIAPEEINTMLLSAGFNLEDFVTISKPDIPPGNKRYLIFSKKVPQATIGKINQAILTLVPVP
ncbi:MAG: transporter substrate-binding domain-containing protein [Desulfobacteraceae bacterium]|nr:transporter substrate-binding domain-containing protein [Desulfobacteraceae bacterium]